DIGHQAAQRVLGALGAQKISTRKTPVLYPADMARSLFGMLLSAISGGAQYRKASFLLDAKGQTIFPDFVTLEEQPHIAEAIGSRPMDAEGVVTQNKVLVVDGVLQDYLLSSYSARRLGLETTGNAGGISNLIVSPTAGGYDDLVKQMNTGFIVTSVMGHGFNAITGDYSYGARGFWVENGEIQHAVNEVSIASNVADMFKGIVAIGNDIDTRGSIRTGSVLIDEMTLAGS
ncbi:MAG: metalloprotease PmbA, partial [Gammaproteobacteria bacterium]|nr:metalloprotease PmbA [Gammaproteobacteria bacterium]